MPLELALLPVVESAFEPYAYSRARASGLWQFISGTGSLYGLKQDWWYDGRRDVVASTRAALDYLQALHDDLGGDWLLAIAAYNCGEGNVHAVINRNLRLGRPTNFWHLKLPPRRSTVPKLWRCVCGRPRRLWPGVQPDPDEPYLAQVATGGRSICRWRRVAGITQDELYALNPPSVAGPRIRPGPGLLVPVQAANGLEQTLLSLTPEQRMRVDRYEVRHGDTVASIATQYSTTPELLRHLNNMDSKEKPVIGAQLLVPSTTIQLPEKAMRAAALFDRPGRIGGRRGSRHGLHVVRRGDTLYGIAHRLGTDVATLARLNNMDVSDPLRAGQRLVVSSRAPRAEETGTRGGGSSPANGRQVTYTVRRGDTLYSIARFLQVTVRDLLGWNGIATDGAIRPGQKLVAFVNGHG
jgi:membrane-bound lytic murein transglycosylase D